MASVVSKGVKGLMHRDSRSETRTKAKYRETFVHDVTHVQSKRVKPTQSIRDIIKLVQQLLKVLNQVYIESIPNVLA